MDQRAEALFKTDEWPKVWRGTPAATEELGSLQSASLAALTATNLDDKIARTRSAAHDWYSGNLG